MRLVAKKAGVVTQMGNQIQSTIEYRSGVILIKQGVIGKIKELHAWTGASFPQRGRPPGEDPVPETLDWDKWIGTAPMRPYKKGIYHSFNWRGVVDFGSGALGDMACHTTDGIYAIMDPGYAATAEPLFMTDEVKDQWPAGMTVKATYRANKTEKHGPLCVSAWPSCSAQKPAMSGTKSCSAPISATRRSWSFPRPQHTPTIRRAAPLWTWTE